MFKKILNSILPPPSVYAYDCPKTQTQKRFGRQRQQETRQADNVFYNDIADTFETRGYNFETQSFEFDLKEETKKLKEETSGKVPTLTERDKLEIEKRQLNIAAAKLIKPYFAKEMPRAKIAAAINQKGLSQSEIGKYIAAFNAAISTPIE